MAFFKLSALVLLLISGVRAGPCESPSEDEGGNANTPSAYGWFPGYDDEVDICDVDFSYYDALSYSFVIPTSDISFDMGVSDADTKMLDFVNILKEEGVEPWVSIGGWDGSRYFSPAVATEENRTLFVDATLSLVEKYGFTGIDFDWEYPSSEDGHECNQWNEEDSVNFLSFLQELRDDERGANLTISASVAVSPFQEAEKEDIVAFAEVLDHISIMNYENYGPWTSTSGPNAPLDNNETCTGISEPQGSSAVASVKAWTDAGFPANQIVLGVPAFGRLYYNVSFEAAFNGTILNPYVELPEYDSESLDCNAPEEAPSDDVLPSTIEFSQFVAKYFTQESMHGRLTISMDTCSQTPFLYDHEEQLLISYDNEESFEKKGEFIRENGLKGFAMWHVIGDHESLLVDNISVGMGR